MTMADEGEHGGAGANVMCTASDPFVEYDRRVKLPPIAIAAAPAAGRVDGVEIQVRNRAAFPYDVELVDLPPWLLGGARRSLSAGESCGLHLSLDPAGMPPGTTRGRLALHVTRPFLSRRYPVDLIATARYSGPAPLVAHRIRRDAAGRDVLRVVVVNVGGGLLQGYFYDRGTNTHRRFVLSARANLPTGTLDATPAAAPRAFRERKLLSHTDASRAGVSIICDCVNPRLRRHDIDTRTDARLVEAPFLDLLGSTRGRARSVETRLRTRQPLAVSVPEALRACLTWQVVEGERVRFLLAADPDVPDFLAGHVDLRVPGGTAQRVPVLISFAAGSMAGRAPSTTPE